MAAGPAPAARVFVLSDHEVVIVGLAGLLGPYRDRVELLGADPQSSVSAPPDVVLYDVLRLVERGPEELEHYVRTSKGVVALTRELRPELGLRATAHGAAVCVSLGACATEILRAVETVWLGTTPVPPPEDEYLGKAELLTRREAEVMGLIARGLTNTAIAEEVGVSLNTVKTYVRSAYQKAGVATRPQAVAWAIERGFDPHPSTSDEPAQPSVLQG
jgi:DNA-binding NarL/FixJ family response regulator